MDLSFDPIRLRLVPYFRERSEISAALLFGSRAQGRARSTSDVDIALLAALGDTGWDESRPSDA